MTGSIPVAYVDDLLDLRRGWVTTRLEDGRVVITRFVGDGQPLGHLSLGVEEAAKLVAVLQAWLGTALPPEFVEENRQKYLKIAALNISAEKKGEQHVDRERQGSERSLGPQ